MTFAVVVRIRGVEDPTRDDPETEKLCMVLEAVTMVALDGGRLGGGGGYGDPTRFRRERADVAYLLFQKNKTDGSGDLMPCTDGDRECVRAALRTCPLVETFLVGPLHDDDDDRDGGCVEQAVLTEVLLYREALIAHSERGNEDGKKYRIDDPRIRAFLIDLGAVLKRYDASISSCGCCDGCGASIGGAGHRTGIAAQELDFEPGPRVYEFSADRIDRALAAVASTDEKDGAP